MPLEIGKQNACAAISWKFCKSGFLIGCPHREDAAARHQLRALRNASVRGDTLHLFDGREDGTGHFHDLILRKGERADLLRLIYGAARKDNIFPCFEDKSARFVVIDGEIFGRNFYCERFDLPGG